MFKTLVTSIALSLIAVLTVPNIAEAGYITAPKPTHRPVPTRRPIPTYPPKRTPAPKPTPRIYNVEWTLNSGYLKSETMKIVVRGKEFPVYGGGVNVTVTDEHINGTDIYILKSRWMDYRLNEEMAMEIKYKRTMVSSSPIKYTWYVDNIRTYDGTPSKRWLDYSVSELRSPLPAGVDYINTGDVTLSGRNRDSTGMIFMHDVALQGARNLVYY